MIKKMGGNARFNQVIVSLILAYRHKRKHAHLRYFPRIKELLDILVDINYISNYSIIKSGVLVFLSYKGSGRPSWSCVRIYNKPSTPIRISSKAAREIFYYNRAYLAVVWTRMGLATSDTMIRTNMSGRLLYLFF